MSLPDFAEQMSDSLLIAKPGTLFSYGEASMQTAGGCAEIATGQLFTSLFQQRIAVPLGMTNTAYTVYTRHDAVGSRRHFLQRRGSG